MKIGTPLSLSATRAMLLGSSELGKEVIAVDCYEKFTRSSNGTSCTCD
jgi:formate-dependent phosphoribosylglycinamide formyltransferase (GAR transformylase)